MPLLISFTDEKSEPGFVHGLFVHGLLVNGLWFSDSHALLQGEERIAFGDAGYQGVEKREDNRPPDVKWPVALRPGQRRALPDNELGRIEEKLEKLKASVRAKVEHPFHLIKNIFQLKKVRYRGLVKNTAQLLTLFGLANLGTQHPRCVLRGQQAAEQG